MLNIKKLIGAGYHPALARKLAKPEVNSKITAAFLEKLCDENFPIKNKTLSEAFVYCAEVFCLRPLTKTQIKEYVERYRVDVIEYDKKVNQDIAAELVIWVSKGKDPAKYFKESPAYQRYKDGVFLTHCGMLVWCERWGNPKNSALHTAINTPLSKRKEGRLN